MYCDAKTRQAAIAKFGAIEDWDVHLVTSMRGLFRDQGDFNEDIFSHWNTSSVTDMSEMLYGASRFNQPVEKMDTSKVTDMRAMFAKASSFNQPVEGMDTRSVTEMRYMFLGASSFTYPEVAMGNAPRKEPVVKAAKKNAAKVSVGDSECCLVGKCLVM